MNSITTKKAQRFLFLKKLYEISNGNQNVLVKFRELGQNLGFSEETTDSVIEYLRGERLLNIPTFGTVCLTHLGVKEIEDALCTPSEISKYFPAVNNITIINGNVTCGGDFIGRDYIVK